VSHLLSSSFQKFKLFKKYILNLIQLKAWAEMMKFGDRQFYLVFRIFIMFSLLFNFKHQF